MRYKKVATGGTFDHLHKGHIALLEKSFEVGEEVIIGVTSDEFVIKEGKRPDFNYDERVKVLEDFLKKRFPNRKYTIAKLDDYFGPAIRSPDIEALVASKETASRIELANKIRAKSGSPPLELVVVDYVLAEDGKPISSTRIRRGEIDEDGRLIKR